MNIFLLCRRKSFLTTHRFWLTLLCAFLAVQTSLNVQAKTINIDVVRPDYYSIVVESTRSADKPRIVNTWAHVTHNGELYRALIPSQMVRSGVTQLDLRWSPGSSLAGGAEKVELQWRWRNEPQWQTQLLGEGFRDPDSGHLILSTADLHWGTERSGRVELRFLIHDGSGQILQDGGPGSVLNVQVDSRAVVPSLVFSENWSVTQRGEIRAGESFEIFYDFQRLISQIQSSAAMDAPWCVFAKLQFDDGPVLNYPLLASHRDHPEKVVGIIPTVQVPDSARRLAIWFFAFHNSTSYFDSNFGQNYYFTIKQP